MTRKDYVLLAAALADSRPLFPARAQQWRADCERIADALARDNTRFDRERFLKACGLG